MMGFAKKICRTPQAKADTDPLARIIAVWDLVSDKLKPLSSRSIEKPKIAKPDDVRHAIHELTSGAWSLSWTLLTSQDDFHKRQDTIYNLMKVIPSFHAVLKHIDDIVPDPVEGVGIFKGDDILETRMGYAVYESKERAEEALKYWDDDDLDISLKAVRLSVNSGLEVLE